MAAARTEKLYSASAGITTNTESCWLETLCAGVSSHFGHSPALVAKAHSFSRLSQAIARIEWRLIFLAGVPIGGSSLVLRCVFHRRLRIPGGQAFLAHLLGELLAGAVFSLL